MDYLPDIIILNKIMCSDLHYALLWLYLCNVWTSSALMCCRLPAASLTGPYAASRQRFVMSAPEYPAKTNNQFTNSNNKKMYTFQSTCRRQIPHTCLHERGNITDLHLWPWYSCRSKHIHFGLVVPEMYAWQFMRDTTNLCERLPCHINLYHAISYCNMNWNCGV